jgi:RNA polymerase sigma factor (sigma-70 family)
MNQRLPLVINRSLLARLDREWQALNQRPAVLRRAAGWGLGIEFASLDEVVAAAGYRPAGGERVCDRDPSSAAANEVLRLLLAAARTDDVAARVVLQRLLPGVVGTARRWGAHRQGGSMDAFDEMLSATWMVIREFPTERRSRHLAASVLRAGEYRAFQQAHRRLMVHEPTAPNLLDLPVDTVVTLDVADELAEVVACASSLTERELHLIEMLARGCSSTEIAKQLSVSVRTVRNHRDAVVHRLREAALAA